MAKEIERKFLVKDKWQPQNEGIKIAQGYLSTVPERTVRVRVKGNQGYLTIKGKNRGISRAEFEYEIPLGDAEELLKLAEQPILSKTRYLEQHGDSLWEIDVFAGDNQGLIVAEVELPHEQADFFRPEWLGEEVSGDVRYYNANLIKNPFSRWKK
ncbi:MAG: CYTH domain-containing protein [Selenomonas sp.]|uniref:CYTH domain-containing protein n=1 Tax=Selenomonas ruminantium TaxID=971 RepID=UPI001B27004A|nr:CYTH domain-containing protein [Selenomonas ruminantium]MBO5650552.1 CYTH domain-containing protein [Selenomonas sp.]MBO6202567.1 CYTH domain-containing protein [Selenomonas sp.]